MKVELEPGRRTMAASNMQQPAVLEDIEPNVLEQQRAERIKLNNAAMAAIGLQPMQLASWKEKRVSHGDDVRPLQHRTEIPCGMTARSMYNWAVMDAPTIISCLSQCADGLQKPRRAADRPAPESTRQSARLRHAAPEVQPVSE